jgi:protein gp37
MPQRLDEPARVRKPGRVFVGSMTDVFHESGTAGMRQDVFDAMRAAPWHTFIILTKRPWNITPGMEWPDNWWLGVSAENQETANARVPLLLDVPACVRFVSVEPMLEPVDLASAAGVTWWDDPVAGIHWVIAGPETGPKARGCEDGWIDGLAEESACFFDKRVKWGRREWPA